MYAYIVFNCKVSNIGIHTASSEKAQRHKFLGFQSRKHTLFAKPQGAKYSGN